MKKTIKYNGVLQMTPVRKLLLTMKITFILLLLGLVHVSASTYAQNTKITLNLKNAEISELFNKIENQTEFRFFYDSGSIDLSKKVTIDVEKSNIEQILNSALYGTGLVYELIGRHIVINRAGGSEHSKNSVGQQQKNISGRVTDDTGLPIVGVTVLVKGTTNGTVTNSDGNYNLSNVTAESTIIFSFIGMVTQEFVVGDNLSINVTMVEDAIGIEEVVAVGYGTMKKSDLTGSVVSLNEGNFTEGPNSNAIQLLSGRASGVNVSQNNSAPGSSLKIQIRGAGSINSSNDVLVVVDGLPGVNPNNISPDDIASVEILKDASASAIYGSRAANGVVLITTKRGKLGAPMVTYNAYAGVQSVVKQIDVLNGRQYMEVLNAIREDGGKDPIFTPEQVSAIGEGTNWQDEVFRDNAPVQNHQLSVRGGSERSSYYAGINFFDQQGLVEKSNFQKFNVRSNIDFSPKDFLRFKFSMNFTRSIKNSINMSNAANENAGAISAAIMFDPTLPAGLNENGKYYLNDFIALDNPQALINGITDEELRNVFYGTLVTEIEPVKDLVATIRVGGTLSGIMNSYYRDRSTINGLSNGGIGSRNSTDYSNWLAEFLLTYNKEFGTSHKINLMAGSTFEQTQSIYVFAGSRNFLSDVTLANLLQSGDGDSGDDVRSSKSRNRLNSYLGRANYGFKDRYMLTASIRVDGTSRFADDNKYAFFPSAALAWRISEEPFFSGLSDKISNLKFRTGYGQLGNQGINNFETIQTLVAGGSAVFGSAIQQGVVPARLPNSQLKWETTEEINVGLDFGLFNNRLNGSVEYYVRNTKDQLFSKPLPSVVGFTNVRVNFGEVQNRGIDLQLNSVNITKNDFEWTTSLNLSTLTNEVKELPDFIPQVITGNIGFISNFQIVQVGSALNSFYGYETEGIFQLNDDIANSAQPNALPGHIRFKDQNLDDKIDSEDRVILGKPFPDFTLGISNSIKYKNFSFDMFWQWVEGISALDANVTETFYPTNEHRNRISKYYLNRWTPDNPTNKYPSGVNPTAYGGAQTINSMTVSDASFIRLKTLKVGYDVPIRSSNVSELSLYLAADNVLTFTEFDGFDPDASAFGSSSTAKVIYSSYPLNRTIRFGLNITF